MIPITISTRGRGNFSGRWYPRPDRISIFINVIAKNIDIDSPEFEAAIAAITFHEIIHVLHWRGGCHPASKCRAGHCFLCNLTSEIADL